MYYQKIILALFNHESHLKDSLHLYHVIFAIFAKKLHFKFLNETQ